MARISKNILAELSALALADSQARAKTVSEADLIEKAKTAAPVKKAFTLPRSFDGNSASPYVIAEIKRASPSKGDISSIKHPTDLAKKYVDLGASVISVLTEPHYFKGALVDLETVSRAVDLPVLRKDFITTKYQILEARAYGASLVLLIVAVLDNEHLLELLDYARELGMEALVETHNEEEIQQAVTVGASIIGINVRNLKDFSVDKGLFSKLVGYIDDYTSVAQGDNTSAPSSPSKTSLNTGFSMTRRILKVAESGVSSQADIDAYAQAGADVVLIGEALVRQHG